MIGLTLKSFSGSVLAPGIPNGASFVLFLSFVLEVDLNMETHHKVISVKISDIN